MRYQILLKTSHGTLQFLSFDWLTNLSTSLPIWAHIPCTINMVGARVNENSRGANKRRALTRRLLYQPHKRFYFVFFFLIYIFLLSAHWIFTASTACIVWVHGTNTYAERPPMHWTDKQATINDTTNRSKQKISQFILKLLSMCHPKWFSHFFNFCASI